MAEFGYWLSGEEHAPRALLEHAELAEAAGIDRVMVSDHFHPWTRRQGQAPFVWTLLGAIGNATELHMTTGVTAPVRRIHPVVVAQAAATTAAMFPGRFTLGVGSGERLNEQVVGGAWPPSAIRREMLEEAVTIIRRLFTGEAVTHRGTHFAVDRARLFTRPDAPPDIAVAAAGKEGAALAGRIGDALIGVAPDGAVVDAFEGAGGTGKPRLAQAHLCWAEDADEAAKTAHEWWPNAALSGSPLTELATPGDFEAALANVRVEDVAKAVPCGPDPEQHAGYIRRYIAAGYDVVYLHQVGPDQRGFLKFWESELAALLV